MKFEEKGTGTFSEAKTSFSVKNQVTLVLKDLCLVKWCHIQEFTMAFDQSSQYINAGMTPYIGRNFESIVERLVTFSKCMIATISVNDDNDTRIQKK